MEKQQENLQSDLSQNCTSRTEKLHQKTSTKMWEVFERELEASSSSFIIDKIIELNPDVEIKTDPDKTIIFASVPVERLVLPEWFYYNLQNEITNKYNTQFEVYWFVQVYPIEYYNSDFI